MGIRKYSSPSARNERPRLELSRTRIEFILEFIAAAGVVLGLFTLLTMYAQLPDKIPVHFNFRGEPDSWGGKETIWIIGALSLILYASMTLISRAPHMFNFPWSINTDNAERQYRTARTFLTLLKTEIVWFFAFLINETIKVGQNESTRLPPISVFLFLAVVAVSVVGFFVLSYRAR